MDFYFFILVRDLRSRLIDFEARWEVASSAVLSKTPKMLNLELARGCRGGHRGSGSGVKNRCSDPPFHTRRGSG